MGPRAVFSERGLLSTVAYRMGPGRPAAYALEGSVAVAGAASIWLKDRLGCIDKVAGGVNCNSMAIYRTDLLGYMDT